MTEALHLGRVFGSGNMAGSQKKNNAQRQRYRLQCLPAATQGELTRRSSDMTEARPNMAVGKCANGYSLARSSENQPAAT
jgi:hypothetical protein